MAQLDIDHASFDCSLSCTTEQIEFDFDFDCCWSDKEMDKAPLLKTNTILYGGRNEHGAAVFASGPAYPGICETVVGDVELRMLTMPYLVHVHSLLLSQPRASSSYDDGQVKSWQEATEMLWQHTKPGAEHYKHWRAILFAGGSKKIQKGRGANQSSSQSAPTSSSNRHRRLFFAGVIGLGIEHQEDGSVYLKGGILLRPELQTMGIGSDAVQILINQYIHEHKEDPAFNLPVILHTATSTLFEQPLWDSRNPNEYKNPAVFHMLSKLHLVPDDERVPEEHNVSEYKVYWRSKLNGKVCGIFDLYQDALASKSTSASTPTNINSNATWPRVEYRKQEATFLLHRSAQMRKMSIPLEQVQSSKEGLAPWESISWARGLLGGCDQGGGGGGRGVNCLEQDRVLVLKARIPPRLIESSMFKNCSMTMMCLQGYSIRPPPEPPLPLEFMKDSSEAHIFGTPDKYYTYVAYHVGLLESSTSSMPHGEHVIQFMVSRGLRGSNLEHGWFAISLLGLDKHGCRWYKMLSSTVPFQNRTKKRTSSSFAPTKGLKLWKQDAEQEQEEEFGGKVKRKAKSKANGKTERKIDRKAKGPTKPCRINSQLSIVMSSPSSSSSLPTSAIGDDKNGPVGSVQDACSYDVDALALGSWEVVPQQADVSTSMHMSSELAQPMLVEDIIREVLNAQESPSHNQSHNQSHEHGDEG